MTETTALTPLLRQRISAQGGRIPFVDFMAACLYEPGVGYYTSAGRKVGAEGDFYTSSNVNAAFGRLIGRELVQMWQTLGQPADFTVVEVGAGGGQLACDILDGIALAQPVLYATMTYRFIEAEPSLQTAQAEMCATHRQRLAWSSPADLAAGTFAITGCVLSNELIDAFPTHLVEMTPTGLQEVYVSTTTEGFAEEFGELSRPEIALYFARLGIWPEAGQRAEVNLAAGEWLAQVSHVLQRGFVLTIDYGYEALELYGPMRKNGTLLCYWQHQAVADPFLRPGEQDITSHVDFTSLQLRGAELGLTPVWYGEQYRFLMGCGMMEELLSLEQQDLPPEQQLKIRLALKKLMLPEGGMGDTFKVLVQAKGVNEPQLLCQRDWTRGY